LHMKDRKSDRNEVRFFPIHYNCEGARAGPELGLVKNVARQRNAGPRAEKTLTSLGERIVYSRLALLVSCKGINKWIQP
jgi:hypothetical protein